MPSITSLATRLQSDFPDFHFTSSNEFRWSPEEKTVYYDVSSNESVTLLHELAHAILAHTTYIRDIGLLEMERDAWEYTKRTLAPRYAVPISETIAQDSLDTYRDWLHARSACPQCEATGLQMTESIYRCIACGTRWHVNDARFCALRRYKITKNTL
jgi:hypothetical protein